MIGIWWNLRLIHGPPISGPHLTSARCSHRTLCPPAGGCRGGAVAGAVVVREEEVNCKSISTLTSPPPHHRTTLGAGVRNLYLFLLNCYECYFVRLN